MEKNFHVKSTPGIIHLICLNISACLTEPSLHTLKSIVYKMAEFMNVIIEKIDTSDHNLYMYPTVYTGGIDIIKVNCEVS